MKKLFSGRNRITGIAIALIVLAVVLFAGCALEPEPVAETIDTIIEEPALSDDFTVADGFVMAQSHDYFYVNTMRYTASPFALPLTIDNPYASDCEVRLTTADGIQFWVAIQPYGSFTLTDDSPILTYGYVIRRSNDDFVIRVRVNEYGSGYNVVPRTVDPWNAYDIDDVRAYVASYPAFVVAGYEL
jgi:hypothetical protein